MDIGNELSDLWAWIIAKDNKAIDHFAAFVLLFLFWLCTRTPSKKTKDTQNWHDNRQN